MKGSKINTLFLDLEVGIGEDLEVETEDLVEQLVVEGEITQRVRI